MGGAPNGGNGQAWGGALFTIGASPVLNGNTFVNNSASTAAPDQFSQIDVLTVLNGSPKPVLSWPTNAIGFHVQYATNLTPPVVWNALSGGISANGAFFQQSTTNVPTTSAFFRLSLTAP